MKTKGTLMAEEARKLTNNCTPEEREELLATAMRIIYSEKKPKTEERMEKIVQP